MLAACTLITRRWRCCAQDPNYTAYEAEGLTVLMVAVMGSNGGSAMVELLLRQGASTTPTGPCRATALHFACELEEEQAALALVGSGAHVDAKDEDGMSALEVAEAHASEGFVAALRKAVGKARSTKKAKTNGGGGGSA
jgi:ankyrin repeat protein